MSKLHSNKPFSVMIGLVAMVVIWLSASISIPLIKRYDEFRPEVLLLVRGGVIIFALLLIRSRAFRKRGDWNAYFGGFLLAISSILFFQAVSFWAANPVIIILTLLPLVNFAIALGERTRICPVTILSLLLVIGGVAFALDIFDEKLDWIGLTLSILTVLCAGLGVECWSRTQEKMTGKMLPYSTFLVGLSFLVLFTTPGKIEIIPEGTSLHTALYVFSIIGCVSGVLYICCTSIAVERLPVTTASILFQGETPAVIIGSWYFVGERLTILQGIGVAAMLAGIILLMWWTTKTAQQSKTPPP